VKYTDPDGKWFLLDDLIVAFIAISFGYQKDYNVWELTWELFKSSWRNPISHGKDLKDFIVKLIDDRYVKEDEQFYLNDAISVGSDGVTLHFDDNESVSVGPDGIFFHFKKRKGPNTPEKDPPDSEYKEKENGC
jgi:hypothetical protein